MTRRLVATYLVLAAVVLVALEVPLGIVHARSQRDDLQTRVERDAVALGALVEDTLQAGAQPGDPTLRRIVARYAASTGARVVVVGPTGLLLADSDDARALARDFSTRPEIASALEGVVATGTRRSETLDTNLLYVAVPVTSGGVLHGTVRTSVPTSRVDSQIMRYWFILAGVALVVLATVAIAGRWLALWVTRPITDLRDAARRAEGGDLGVRADASEGPEEVRELAHAFNDMVSRLDLLIGTQEQFVADASHQLRSPLTALRLRIENLEHEVGPEVQDELGSAIDEVDRLSRLVNGLLALARADRRAPERAELEIGGIARERGEAWQALGAERDVAVEVDAAPGLRVLLSPGALEQVLDNLIANALEVAPPGTTVRVTAAPEADGGVRLEVVDEGPGMEPAEREHAFDRFWRGREDHPGSGLGLAIVRRLVEADGGTVALHEAPGGGLRAVVALPSPAVSATR